LAAKPGVTPLKPKVLFEVLTAISKNMQGLALTQSGDFAANAPFYQATWLRTKSRISACEIWPGLRVVISQ
jgi:hypothetical protein